MAKREILAGATDQTIDVFIEDVNGSPITGLVYNSSGLTCYYRKGATGAATALTLATQTVAGAHSDGGFVLIDATNMPGVYRLDLSDTIVATAGMSYLVLNGYAGMAPCVIELEVVAVDKFNATSMGISKFADIEADTQDLQTQVGTAGAGLTNINLPNQTMDIVGNITGNLSGSVGSLTTNNDKTGYGLSAAAVQAIWDAATSALTTAGSIGKWILDKLDVVLSTRLASASYTAPLDAAGTRSAVGLASANLDTQLTAIDDYLDTEVAAIKAKTDQLTFTVANQVDSNALSGGGSGLDAAGVRAAVGLASANLDTQLGTIDDLLDTEVAAIKAKTDQLTFTVGNQVDANIQYVNDVQVNGTGTDGDEWGP